MKQLSVLKMIREIRKLALQKAHAHFNSNSFIFYSKILQKYQQIFIQFMGFWGFGVLGFPHLKW